TSRTNTQFALTANCTFMRPITPSSRASATVCRRMSVCTAASSEYGGSEQALSPECTPARSMCSMMPPITTSRPSLTASTSTSTASSRNWSMRTGCAGETHGQAERRLPPELDDDTARILPADQGDRIFERQRLEVELVRRVVVGAHGLGVAVDHDRLEAVIPKCQGRMDAAVVELDP